MTFYSVTKYTHIVPARHVGQTFCEYIGGFKCVFF